MIYYTFVELIDAAPEDQAKLDERMDAAGFSRTTRSRTGQDYTLPRGVYRSQGPHHASEVLEIARGAADSTGRKNEVLTIEAARARWFPNAETAPA